MAAVIGSLRAILGLDSAEFESGLKKAKVGMNGFIKTAGVGFAAVATAAAAAGVALGVAVKGAIDNADQMGEMAQKVGVSVEALSSLGYAAKLSGADTETLATSLRKLSQNMLAVAQGSTGPVATAFNALGVSVQQADGSLRASDQVLLDVAEKFARMEDGATKTALAVQLFGKSGAELVPFLSQGRDGIAALTAEADRLGITISGTTAARAGAFNDTLDRMRATFDGVVNKIAGEVLPSVNELGAKLSDPQFAASAQAIGLAIVDGMKLAVDSINTVVGALNSLKSAMDWANNHDIFGNEIQRPGGDKTLIEDEFRTRKDALAALGSGGAGWKAGGVDSSFFGGIFGAPASQVVAESQMVADAFVPVIENTKAAASGASALKTAMSEGKAVFEATRTPAEAYGLEVERLNRLLQQGAIDQDTYNRAVAQAQDAFDSAKKAGIDWSSSLSDGFAGVFTSILDGSKNAMDAVGDLTRSLAQMALQQGFKALLGNIFGGGNGGGFLSGIFNIGKNANGTKNWRGGLTMVGERGPELVSLPGGSQIIRNSELNRGGGGGEIYVSATMQVVDGNLVPVITQVSGQVAGQQIKSYDRQLPSRLQEIDMRQ